MCVLCLRRRIGWPTPNQYGFGTGRIWLDDVVCLGREQFIGECRSRGWGRHDCRHYEDVAVVCMNATDNGMYAQVNSASYPQRDGELVSHTALAGFQGAYV